MESINNDEIVPEFRFFRTYKNGHVETFYTTQKVPLSNDSIIGVQSKDIVISSQPAISVRIFLPKFYDLTQKLPILLYIHGGGFCFESAFSPLYHNHVNSLVSKAHIIAVSVEYGLFPNRPIPACYEDSWAALKWAASHGARDGPESWLNEYADFDRAFIGGDSAGANISHNLAVQIGLNGLPGIKLTRIVMVHPFFGGLEEDDRMWLYMCPDNGGLQDPRLKPPAEDLARIGCGSMLIFFAAEDHLREVGQRYYEELKKSEWVVEVVEHEGESHAFHLFKPETEKTVDIIKRFGAFINRKSAGSMQGQFLRPCTTNKMRLSHI